MNYSERNIKTYAETPCILIYRITCLIEVGFVWKHWVLRQVYVFVQESTIPILTARGPKCCYKRKPWNITCQCVSALVRG